MLAFHTLNTWTVKAAAIVVGTMLGHSALAIETPIIVENCSDSHHEVNVAVTVDDGANSYDSSSGSVHSGTSKEFWCNTSSCTVTFSSGSYSKSEKNGIGHWYVHVKKSHKLTVSQSSSKCE